MIDFDEIKQNSKKRNALAYLMMSRFDIYFKQMFYFMNGKKPYFLPFHKKICDKLQSYVYGENTKRNLGICLPVGCVAGDTIIRYNRASLGRKHTIKELYEKTNGISRRKNFDMSIKTNVRSFIEKENRIRLNEIKEIVYSGKKEVYKLTLEDGKSIKATPEHKIMTKEGYKQLISLTNKDYVMVDNIFTKQDSKVKIKKKEKIKCVGKYHPYSKTSDNYSWRVEYHRAVYEANLNNMSLDEFCLACKSENNLKFVNPSIYHIHHKDFNHRNNDISNLVCLTKEEHLKIHGNYNHFGYGIPEYSRVKSIEYVGIEDTYDICCYDNHNFNANDIIVHNSGKSIICQYFITWCFARSINTTFCYVSHSDMLIRNMSRETKDIVSSDEFKFLFSRELRKDDKSRTNYSFEGANNRTGMTAGALGSALTGLDAGNPSINGFSGALIADDLMDLGHRTSEVENENVIRLLNEKLATRRRTPTTPTILIMQRISKNDVIGWLKENEPDDWEFLEIPALNDDNTSFWEERYPVKELLHIKEITPFKFYSQYQQAPIIEGGSMIKREWWKYYDKDYLMYNYNRIFITADTAFKTNEWNDYTAIGVWGMSNNKLFLLDLVHGKFEAPELEGSFMALYNKWRDGINNCPLSAIYIEDKASGTGLIQNLQRNRGLPILPVTPNKDKRTRVLEAIPQIASGNVLLPFNENSAISKEVLAETDAFSDDLSHKNDDICDMLCYAIQYGFTARGLF